MSGPLLLLCLAAAAGPEVPLPPPAAPPETQPAAAAAEDPAAESPEAAPGAFAGAPPSAGTGAGAYLRLELGGFLLAGPAAAGVSPGFAGAVAGGFAPLDFLELGGFALGGLTTADEGFGPPARASLDLRAFGAEGRLRFPVWRLRLGAGGGFAWVSLRPVGLVSSEGFGGERTAPVGLATVEYAAYHPRFAAGLTGRWLHGAAAPGTSALALAATLRYQF